MKFENILQEVGGFGLYQQLLCLLLIPLSTGLVGLVYYAQLFVLYVPYHTCVLPEILNTSTATPANGSFDLQIFHPLTCHQPSPAGVEESLPCTEWRFDYDSIFPTLSSQNLWVCDEAWRPYTILTSFWIGNMIGAWILGVLSDKIGRRPVVMICYLVYGVAGTASAFVTNFYGHLILRTLVGSVHHTLTHLPFVLAVEFCVSSKRVVPLLAIMMSYTLSTMLSTLIAYLIWSWQGLVLITSLPALVIVLGYRWLPESVSWQLLHGKEEEAIDTLLKIAQVNKKQISRQDIIKIIKDNTDNLCKEENEMQCEGQNNITGNETTNPTLISALKYPIILKRIVVTMLVWMVGCMCYYGNVQNTSNLGQQILLNYLLGAVVEIPAWCAPWLIEKLGRKRPLMVAFVVSGVVGVVYSALTGVVYSSWIALVGRLVSTIAYFITLQYGPEVFPTEIRGQGVALAETMGGVAIFLSPSIVYLGEYIPGMPLLVFGGLSLLAAGLTVLLPETKGNALPHTLLQAERDAAQK